MQTVDEKEKRTLEEATQAVGKAFESMETLGDLVKVLVENPTYVFRVRYDPMDNKIVTRLGSTTGYYSEVKYNLGDSADW